MTILILLLTSTLHAQTPAWEQRRSMTVGTFDAAVSVAGDRIVLTGGIGQGGGALDFVQIYDPAADTWAPPMKLPLGRHSHAQVTLDDGRILLAGGQKGAVSEGFAPLASAVVIDLVKQSVTPAPDLPDAMHSPTGHRLADGRIAIVGGRRVALFNPQSMTWDAFVQLRQSRQEHATVLLPGGRILVVGGTSRDTLECVDVAGKVSQLLSARLPMPLDDMAASLLPDGRVWITGGQNSATGQTTDATWIVDLSNPAKTTLTAGPPLGIQGGVADHCAEILGKWLVIAGGESEIGRRDVELAKSRIGDRRSLEVWSLPDLAVVADDASAVRWGNAVYVLGGYHQGKLFEMTIPVASRAVQRLTLPAERLGEEH